MRGRGDGDQFDVRSRLWGDEGDEGEEEGEGEEG